MTSGVPSPKRRPGPAPVEPGPQPVAPQPRKPRRRWWVAALILAAVAAGALYMRNSQLQPLTGGGPPVLTVPTATVAVGPLERSLRLTGSTAAKNYIILKAPQMRGGRGGSIQEVREISTGARSARGGGGGGMAGGVGGGGGGGGVQMMQGARGGQQGPQITLVSLVPAGSKVKKGDVVAEFDREDMLVRLDSFKTTIDQNEANLASVRAQIEVAEKDHALSMKEAIADVERARLDLKTAPVRGEIDRERYRLALEEAEAVYKQGQIEVPLQKTSLESQWKSALLSRDEGLAELKRVEANVDRMVLRAPMDGLVVMMTLQRRGSADQAQIKAGDQVGSGQALMQIVDLSAMVVNATINQADAEQLRVGAKARVRFDAYPDLELPAEVYGIGAMPRASQFRADYVREVSVALRLLKLDPRVIPDLSVSADVVLETVPDALITPLESVFRDDAGGKPYVFLRGPEGWAKREVELVNKNYLAAAVRSGLKAGDAVATTRPPTEESGKKR